MWNIAAHAYTRRNRHAILLHQFEISQVSTLQDEHNASYVLKYHESRTLPAFGTKVNNSSIRHNDYTKINIQSLRQTLYEPSEKVLRRFSKTFQCLGQNIRKFFKNLWKPSRKPRRPSEGLHAWASFGPYFILSHFP